jgi:CBS domain-containing protein
MHVATLLSGKGAEVVTVPRSASVAEALGVLARHQIGALVVSDDGRRIAGIISERDIVRALDAAGPMVLDQRVATLMSIHPQTCQPTDVLEDIMGRMTELRVRHLPVVVDGEVAGIVSIGDVVKARIDELEANHRQLVDYITAR